LSRSHVLTIEISLPSQSLAKVIYRTLKLEIDTGVLITIQGSLVMLHIEANTIAALRASTNSYLRWIAIVNNIIDAVKGSSSTTN
jgi:tRNA threonylcarbamoyladenosine modification (KEOPS) complex  Pcc1 subunit